MVVGAESNHWTLDDFRRHPKALNDLSTQVAEVTREASLALLGGKQLPSINIGKR
jgi:hypothetical protein